MDDFVYFIWIIYKLIWNTKIAVEAVMLRLDDTRDKQKRFDSEEKNKVIFQVELHVSLF